MSPVGSRSPRVGVLGAQSTTESLSGWDGDQTIDAESIDETTVVDSTDRFRSFDCVVIEGTEPSRDCVDIVEQCVEQRPGLLVVVLTDREAVDPVDALEAGADETLPSHIVDVNPDLLGEQVIERVEYDRARTVFQDLYDRIDQGVTLHDPETGETLHANQPFCEMVGYARDEVQSIPLAELTADVPGYDGERARYAIRSAHRQEDALTVEWPFAAADGTVRWTESRLDTVTFGRRTLVLWASTDVTERRRAEHRYEQVFDGVNDVITVHDPWEEEVIDVNETACNLTGYGREALLGMGIDGFSATEEGYTAERAYEIQQRVAAEGESETLEWVIETASGDQRRLETVLSPATIAGQDRVLVLARDVTERAELERSYRDIFENVSDGLVVHDPETGEILDVNERYCTLTGYDRTELIGSNIRRIVPDDSEYTHEAALAQIEQAREEGSQLFEFEGERKDGDTFLGEIHLDTVEVHGEERVLASVRDVTERAELERSYRGIFENVSDGLVVHDPETGEILDVNERFCEMNGYERDDLVGSSVDLITGPEHDYERVRERITAAREGEPQLFEWLNQRPDGETFPVEVHLSVVEIRGAERVLASVRDITERKRREREYEQIFDGVQEGILVINPRTLDILDANEAYLDLVGYDNVETIREKGVEGLSATGEGYTVEEGLAVHRRVAETGEPEVVEWRAETRTGERRWFEVKVAPAVINGEEVNVAINRDVTERKRREREYEQIFNGVTDAITVHDPETTELLDVNETFCELLGYDREAILEMGVAGYSPDDVGPTIEEGQEFILDVVDSGETKRIEWPVETHDGEIRWLEIKGTTAVIGGELRYISISRDVTEQRRTERRLSAILDRIDEAIFMTRAGEITEASQAPDYVSAGYEAIWGQPLEDIRELYEDGFFGTLHPDDESEYRALVEQIVDEIDAGTATDSYSHEYRIERPDGEVRWIHSDYYPTTWESGPQRIVIVSRDVTDRKARERRIASFDDATDDLATASTPGEATRTAVDAATGTLDLPAVGAFLYDGDDGVLRPEVLTDSLPVDDADPVEPGDGPLWEAFATGSIVASDGQASEETSMTPPGLDDLEEWRAIALGNHGILLVGSPDGSLDSETIQAAHVLAATLEAALNHLRGEQRLAAQEEQLRTQTERAERLDRIARLTQQVEAAITDASYPGEVEQAVCERLASPGSYELAWIGGIDVGSNRLTARAVVGAPSRHVETLELTTTDDTADPHPAVAAWRNGEVTVADSLVADGPADDWRGRALEAGFQSLCAVPLTYDGVTHGVLTVGSDSPQAFGDREQDVLAQLGTSIANALAAVERRRALESDETVELEFRGSGGQLPFVRAAERGGCRVALERTVARQDGRVSVYYDFEGDLPDDVSEIARRTLPGSVNVVTEESTSALVETQTDDWFGSPVAEYGGVLREASANPDGVTITVEVPREADIRSFMERLQSVAPSLELVAQRQHQRRDRTPAELSDQISDELTDRQFEVLQTALSAGYFEWPRENDGSDVAERLDITQPTLNKHLRLAEKQTFELLFDA